MANYIRPRIEGGRVFFTVRLALRGSTLLVDHIDILRDAVSRTRGRRPFEIDAWVVLPDHIHAVWTLPEGDADFSQRWGAIKARFTRDVRRAGYQTPERLPTVPRGRYAGVNPGLRLEKGEVAIWQRRFWEHHIRSPQEHRDAIRYCLMDPVKHGLAERPEDWVFSSIHRDMRAGRWAA